MRGGKRIGAGRKKGARNKRTAALREAVAASGLTPLEYMLCRMRDPMENQKVRAEMAIAAAPYCHPRIASLELTGKNGGPIQQQIMALIVDGTEPLTELGLGTRHVLLPNDRS